MKNVCDNDKVTERDILSGFTSHILSETQPGKLFLGFSWKQILENKFNK